MDSLSIGKVAGLSLAILSACPCGWADLWLEDFPGGISSSIFGRRVLETGSGTYATSPLSLAMGAQDGSPPLPINVDGDRELRYFEHPSGTAGSGSFALTAPLPEVGNHQVMDGYVSFGLLPGGNAPSGQFLLRTNLAPARWLINGYSGSIGASPFKPDEITISISRLNGGIFRGISGGSVRDPLINAQENNFRVRFEIKGSQLTLSVWQVSSGGALTETHLVTHTANDTMFTETGSAGLYSFARSGASVFYDDISVWSIPEPGTFVLLQCGAICFLAIGQISSRRP
jgi:hypothetical protein